MAEYIDREALLRDIEHSVVYTAREKITNAEMRGANKVIELIKCAPVVDPVYLHTPTKSEFKRMATQMDYALVVHGKWTNPKGGFWEVSQCSVCGAWFPTTGIVPHYCPNCGARMDGGADE